MKRNYNIYRVFLLAILVSVFSNNIIAQGFAKGADIGWISEMEASGRKFYNSEGTEQDLIQILKDKGINSIRLRVWVNPTYGWNNAADVIAKSVRAKNMGMRIMIDFHYSDSWADPGKQTKPAAWAGYNFTALKTAVYNHTFDVLTSLKANGVVPEWVQVGNETNNGMLWEDGKASVSMSNFAQLVASGYDAVKAVNSSSKALVHISNGYDNALFRWIFDGLTNNGGKWDVIGMSLYPTQSNWASLNNQTLTNMNDMVARYGKEVMMAEVGMDVGPSVTAKAFLSDIIAKTRNLPNNKGLGVFYWEPQAYNRWQGYAKGAFDLTGKPTAAMEAFLENPPSNPVTNFVVNGNFNADNTGTQMPQGWLESDAVAASYTSAGNGWNPDGSYYLNHYQATAYQARTYQTISVPNGRYQLSAWAIRSNGQNIVQLYASNFGGTDVAANITYNDAWAQTVVPNIDVTNGQITIGVFSNANAGNWLNVDAVMLSSLSSLPVSLLSFSATLQPDNKVKLTWKTSSEENNKRYTIARSTDGINFKEVGTVKGNGSTLQALEYSLIDETPVSGLTNIYRLSQTDLDGKMKMLGIAQVKHRNMSSGLQVYPNPAKKNINIKYDGWLNKKVAIQLKSTSGQEVFSIQVVPQNQVIKISLPDLAPGRYVLNILGDGLKEKARVIIR